MNSPARTRKPEAISPGGHPFDMAFRYSFFGSRSGIAKIEEADRLSRAE